MAIIRSLILFSIGVAVCASYDYNDTLDMANAPRPLRDRFRLIQNNINEERLNDEIQDFRAYGCEKMVVIRNKAQAEFKINCHSNHDAPKAAVIQPDNAYAFSFKPLRNGNSKFWCTVEYKNQFARFDVYNEDLSYMCPRDIDDIYQYIVHHDGIYVDRKGDKGEKIRALLKGHNKFILWEEFEDGETDGLLISGLVDGGMCYDVPEQFNDKTAAVTICYNHCVKLFEHYGCRGKIQTVQASDDCIDVGLIEELGGKLSAVKGC